MIDLSVQGNPDRHDSFVACICSILTSWGQKVEYERVAGLSGVVFSPVYNDREDCRAWWMEGGNDIRMEFLGKSLGFSVASLKRKWTKEDETWNANPESKRIPRHTLEHLDKLRTAVKSGKPVLVDTWPTWSVLTGWNEDITRLPFETISSFGNLVARAWPPHRTGKAYIISSEKPLLAKNKANREALLFAEKVATGSFGIRSFQYGGALYKATARRLIHEPFCVPCGNKSYSCGVRTVNRMVESAQNANEYLKTVGADEAASRYKAICDILNVYQDRKMLEEFWSDRKFRFEMRDGFLKAYQIHREAASEIGRFLR